MIIVESKRKKTENIQKKYPGAYILDLTSKSTSEWQVLSPFYPWGDIPIPYSSGLTAVSVEGIWQGLKVFEKADIDMETFQKDTMSGLKRTTRRYGKVLGHRRGVYGHELFDYIQARKRIYIPSYKWMLEKKAYNLIQRLRKGNESYTIILLDYITNCNPDDPSKPLSHAYLVKAYVEGLYPYEDVLETKTIYHCYEGKRTICWTTEVKKFKEIVQDSNKDNQLSIEYDF